MKILRSLAAIVLGIAATGAMAADPWPSQNIRMIVPYSPGGATDNHARLVAQILSDALGRAVVVDNRAGAGGNIGTALVAQAPADGYTLLMGGVGTHAINPALYKNIPYDAQKDFIPVALIGSEPNVLVANESVTVRDLAGLIAEAKRHPGALSYASPGAGTSNHLAMEMLKSRTGMDITHIPYKGGGPAVTDTLGGQVPYLFINLDVALPYIASGKLHALVVSSKARSPLLPDVPSVAESGYPDYEATSWTALYVRAGTPRAIVDRLNAEIVKGLAKPEIAERLKAGGFTTSRMTPEEFATWSCGESEKWGKAVRASGATVD